MPLPLLEEAEIYVPSALRLLARGQVKQLYIGSFVRYVEDYDDPQTEDYCPVEVALEATFEVFAQLAMEDDTTTRVTQFALLGRCVDSGVGHFLDLQPMDDSNPVQLEDRCYLARTNKDDRVWQGRSL